MGHYSEKMPNSLQYAFKHYSLPNTILELGQCMDIIGATLEDNRITNTYKICQEGDVLLTGIPVFQIDGSGSCHLE